MVHLFCSQIYIKYHPSLILTRPMMLRAGYGCGGTEFGQKQIERACARDCKLSTAKSLTYFMRWRKYTT